jgi:hypothetical protein
MLMDFFSELIIVNVSEFRKYFEYVKVNKIYGMRTRATHSQRGDDYQDPSNVLYTKILSLKSGFEVCYAINKESTIQLFVFMFETQIFLNDQN